MDEIVKRKQALTGEVEDAPREYLFRHGMAKIVEGVKMVYQGRAIDSAARKVDEQGEADE